MLKGFAAALLSAVFLLSSAGTSLAQSRWVYWRSWDVRIDNLDPARNRFNVTESYDIDFTGTFRFGTATIPTDRLESIQAVKVSQNGQALRESCSESPGTYCVYVGSGEVSITYYFFSPITDGQSRFEISYTVSGALRVYEGGDQLWWVAIPPEHFGFPIGASTVTVELPPGFAPREGVDPVEAYGVPVEIVVDGTTITAVATRELSGDESLEIRVQYPHNPSSRKAAWQDAFDEQVEFEQTTKPVIDLILIVLGMLISIGGVLGIYALWYTRGRDPRIGPVPAYLTEPPSELPPAVVGALMDEQADLRDVISTIIDLARRGYLVMEETRVQTVSWLGPSSQFTFKRTDRGWGDLKPFEKRMMESLFNGGRMERTMASMQNSFYAVIPKLKQDLYQAMLTDGFFTASPESTRATYTVIGFIILAIAVVIGFSTSELSDAVTQAVLCLPISMGMVGLAILFGGQFMPAKTRKGAEETAKWKAFREYLHNLEKYDDIGAAAEHFDRYLPYAIAFGLDRSWVRRFSQMQTVPIPTWYFPTYRGGRWARGYQAGSPVGWGGMESGSGLPGPLAQAGGGGLDDMSRGIGGGLESISSGLTNFLNSASSAMTSRPSQSGSSGRGFSGGGFRGGGGSGGGSRGFG